MPANSPPPPLEPNLQCSWYHQWKWVYLTNRPHAAVHLFSNLDQRWCQNGVTLLGKGIHVNKTYCQASLILWIETLSFWFTSKTRCTDVQVATVRKNAAYSLTSLTGFSGFCILQVTISLCFPLKFLQVTRSLSVSEISQLVALGDITADLDDHSCNIKNTKCTL